jgi:hypothetical protein
MAAATTCAVVAIGLWRAHESARPIAPSTLTSADGWKEIELKGVGRLSLAPGGRIRLPEPPPGTSDTFAVTLDRGQLCAQIEHRDQVRQGPFIVEAPGLRVTVVGTRFCVFADRDHPSWVFVEQGRVRVDAGGKENVSLGAGECLRADDPWLLPPVPIPAPPGGLAVAEGQTTIAHHQAGAHLAPGRDLADQNLLYQNGVLAERTLGPSGALELWERYRQRYPDGVFTAEVDLRRVRALSEVNRAEAALAAAEEFNEHHPQDWRGNEVELIRADLLRAKFNRPADALAIYRRILGAEGKTAWHERATYGAYRSLLALSKTSEARDEARQYLTRFPNGEHVHELSGQISSECDFEHSGSALAGWTCA